MDRPTPHPTPATITVRARERAQATVEFALILPILCLLLFAVIEFGIAFWNYQQVSAAASEGARRAAVSRLHDDRFDRIEQAVIDASPNLDDDQMVIEVDSTWDSGDPVTVTVRYPEEIRIMGLPFFDDNLTVRRTARVEQ